jgi:hypothetical protein
MKGTALTVVLDTSTLPLRERRDALMATMLDTSGASQVTLDEDEPVHGRLDLWAFGAAAVFRAETSGVSMTRTAKAARTASGEHIAIGVHELGVARHRVGSTTRVVPGGEALVVDVSRPFDYGWQGRGAAKSLNIPVEQLAMPTDHVRKASLRLPSSPLTAWSAGTSAIWPETRTPSAPAPRPTYWARPASNLPARSSPRPWTTRQEPVTSSNKR